MQCHRGVHLPVTVRSEVVARHMWKTVILSFKRATLANCAVLMKVDALSVVSSSEEVSQSPRIKLTFVTPFLINSLLCTGVNLMLVSFNELPV